jgi:hypothetical protein
VISAIAQLLYPQERGIISIISIIQELGWVSGLDWMGSENLAPTEVRTLNCPDSRKTLYLAAIVQV